MTVEEFNTLNEPEKLQAISEGTFLADREATGLIIQLYGLSNFYAEIFYDTKTDTILCLRAFGNIHKLSPYLTKIKLNLS